MSYLDGPADRAFAALVAKAEADPSVLGLFLSTSRPASACFAHTRVLIDRLDGQLTALVREAATFPARGRERLPTMLDAYMNLLDRSLKSWRDGRPLEAHLDAAESMDLALWVIFGMHERLRPPNKYVRWELQRRPFDTERWDEARLLGRVQRILTAGDPETQRSLFRDIESTARANGLGETVDGWGIDLKLMHGDP